MNSFDILTTWRQFTPGGVRGVYVWGALGGGDKQRLKGPCPSSSGLHDFSGRSLCSLWLFLYVSPVRRRDRHIKGSCQGP